MQKEVEKIIELVKTNGESEFITSYPGITIQKTGTGNHVKIYEGTKFTNVRLMLSSDCNISIGKSKFGIINLAIWASEKTVVSIGSDFSCWGVQIRCHEPECEVRIGNDCMFSEEILIYPTDVHAIYDIFENTVLNQAKPILIGDHVWCGRRVSILKGVTIRNDVVIGMGAIVTKKFNENNIVVTGNPAEVVKRGVNWDRNSPKNYAM